MSVPVKLATSLKDSEGSLNI
uniref:Uncharacterized protein n=1 Tax=Rhizophora mucronata TaxID=61149 RepID=A0A2P2IVV3_RHIMU